MIYVALAVLFVAVLLLAAYVRSILRALRIQGQMNRSQNNLDLLTMQRLSLIQTKLRDLDERQRLSEAIQSAKVGNDHMRN